MSGELRTRPTELKSDALPTGLQLSDDEKNITNQTREKLQALSQVLE